MRILDLHLHLGLLATDIDLDAIATMRAISPAAQAFPLYIHDGFNLEQFSWLISNRTDFVVEDHHSYFVFTPQDDSEPASQHTSDVRYSIADSLAAASYRNKRNLIIGEFSCALTDQSLEGEKDTEEARREFCTGQTDIYQNTTAGWAFWGKLHAFLLPTEFLNTLYSIR